MALVRWKSGNRNLAAYPNARDELECLLEEFFSGWPRPPRRPFQMQNTQAWHPRVDVKATEKEYILSAEVPGLGKEDLNVTITKDLVTIKGERKQENEEETDCYYCKETTSGSFERQIALPEHVLSDQAQAKLTNGILTLTLPKAEPQNSGTVTIDVN